MDVVKFTRSRVLGDLVAFELDQNFCRETGTLAGGSGFDLTIKLGAALGKVTASGKLVPISFSASDGSQNFAALATHDLVVPNGVDTTSSYLARGPMIVRAEEITWPAGATTNQIAAAVAQAVALGILVRTSG